MHPIQIAIVSDIHYASEAEQRRGNDYEYKDLPGSWQRRLVKWHRHYLWLSRPLDHGVLLDEFIRRTRTADLVVTLGDYSCDSAFIGLSDDAAFTSAQECMAKIRSGARGPVLSLIGDHELGKFTLVGRLGGMRLASWRRAINDLQLEPIWTKRIGRYVLIGVTSSLVALPFFENEILPAERQEWEELRARHLQEIGKAFDALTAADRVILFCHDPTALPFLWSEPSIQSRLPQVEQTLIGHLHSQLILNQSEILAGIPTIKFLGHSGRRLSSALHEARYWKPFQVRLCPSLAGIELLKDGGFYLLELDPSGAKPLRFSRHHIERH